MIGHLILNYWKNVIFNDQLKCKLELNSWKYKASNEIQLFVLSLSFYVSSFLGINID